MNIVTTKLVPPKINSDISIIISDNFLDATDKQIWCGEIEERGWGF